MRLALATPEAIDILLLLVRNLFVALRLVVVGLNVVLSRWRLTVGMTLLQLFTNVLINISPHDVLRQPWRGEIWRAREHVDLGPTLPL